MELQTPHNNGCQNSDPDPDPKTHFSKPKNGETHQPHEHESVLEDPDSSCSTPYVSAPSSPGRSGPISGFFYSAPASPMHFSISQASNFPSQSSSSIDYQHHSFGFEFEFTARFGPNGSGFSSGSMSSADELFLNGKIRLMKLSTHLEKPQVLAPLLDLEVEDDYCEDEKNEEKVEVVEFVRGRDLRFRDKSLRRTRSLSPFRNNADFVNLDENCNFEAEEVENQNNDNNNDVTNSENTSCINSATSSSRSSSAGRSSKIWDFLKDFLYRSKSEGRSNHKFWSNISFSPAKEKKPSNQTGTSGSATKQKFLNLSGNSEGKKVKGNGKVPAKNLATRKPINGVGKRRVPPSVHELHLSANRARDEEMRKKTFLPYRQGLLGCLGFSSKGYGAMNNVCARSLNPVSSE